MMTSEHARRDEQLWRDSAVEQGRPESTRGAPFFPPFSALALALKLFVEQLEAPNFAGFDCRRAAHLDSGLQ